MIRIRITCPKPLRVVAAFFYLSLVCWAQRPVIFDTDMGNDIDDALALAILHSLSDRGECRLIGVTLTNGSAAAVPYIRLVNSFYGRSNIPVGSATKSIPGGSDDRYLSAALKSAPVALVKKRRGSKNEMAVPLLRKLLAQSSEKVTIIQVGFSSNLAALLDSKPDSISSRSGLELVREKVALLCAMAGNFTGGEPEYNVKLDIPGAKSVFEHWPSPVIFSGFEIGRDLVYPAASIEHDYSYAKWHPVTASYKAFDKMPYDRPTWDLTAALQAVRGDHAYFKLSEKGKVEVQSNGITKFQAGGGDRQFLQLDPAKAPQILEALKDLASEPPANLRHSEMKN